MSIGELKASGNPGNKAIGGKIVQKSDLRTYQTRNKEKKFFFNLGVADETGSIKVMVYGRERYQDIQEKSCYLFREVIMEGNDIKVTKLSIVSKTPQIDVAENLEMEARMLVDLQTPVCSIGQAIGSAEKTSVSVEGKVTEIGSIENRRGKKDKQDFKLEDNTGSIRITLWGEDIKHLRGVSCGDVATVTNVQSAAVQSVTIKIIGIIRAIGTQTELEAELSRNNEVQPFVVASSLLAGALGVSPGGGFEDRLLDKMPFSADVEIKGNQIIKIKSVK